MSAERVTYVDSSAIVKLVVRERESAALARYLRGRRPLVSSALARTEVLRSVQPSGVVAMERATVVLGSFELVRIGDRVLTDAGHLAPITIRSLDAIHISTAALFGRTLRVVVTYDRRMADAAQALGMRTISPR